MYQLLEIKDDILSLNSRVYWDTLYDFCAYFNNRNKGKITIIKGSAPEIETVFMHFISISIYSHVKI